MDNVGIIVAMEEEFDEILNIVSNIKKNDCYNFEIITGNINNTKIVLTKSGVGKVNAARITQILIDKFNINKIINVGSAGALDSNLNIGDIVIANKLIQHDFDITAFNHNKGYITGVGDYIDTDGDLIKKLQEAANKLKKKEYKVTTGIIASGDIFITDVKMKEKIHTNFNAKCVEMEGAAIAQICYLSNIPFAVIRSISDSPNGNNAIVFDEFVKLASKRCAQLLKEFFN